MKSLSWMEQYKEKSDARFPTFYKALELLTINHGSTIVETGCIRFPDDWGAGMSTMLFGEYAKNTHAHVWTVDISQVNMDCCKEVTGEYQKYITYTTDDSIHFLRNYNHSIDLLYLDSMDCPIDAPADDPLLIQSQNHQLTEMQVALPKMSKEALVLLDDNAFAHGGKTKLTKEYLAAEGWTEVLGGQQSLWKK